MQDIQSMFGDRRLRPQNQNPQSIKCPRCDSINTKFCYYNNYNLSQPRHFCKTCRRYWTAGGVLRNVPVGGACRKSKKPKLNHSPETSSDGSTLTTAKNDSVLPDSDVFPAIGKLTAAEQNMEQQLWELPRSDGELTASVSDGLTEGILDRTVSVGLPRSDGGGGFMSLDWQVDGDDQGLFEFTGAVDQGFWSQNQWSSDLDHSLY